MRMRKGSAMSTEWPHLCHHCGKRIIAIQAVGYATAASGFKPRRCCSHRCVRLAKQREARSHRAADDALKGAVS